MASKKPAALLSKPPARNAANAAKAKAKEAAKILANDGSDYKYYWIGADSDQKLDKPDVKGLSR